MVSATYTAQSGLKYRATTTSESEKHGTVLQLIMYVVTTTFNTLHERILATCWALPYWKLRGRWGLGTFWPVRIAELTNKQQRSIPSAGRLTVIPKRNWLSTSETLPYDQHPSIQFNKTHE